MQLLCQDPFLKPMLHMHNEIVRNICIIIHFITSKYLECRQVSAVDFIQDTFQFSITHLAAGIFPAVDLAAAEKTLILVGTLQFYSFSLFSLRMF
jgi:hypothetical protein